MKFKSLLCGLGLAGSLFATDAFAETGWHGYDLRLSITAPIVDQHSKLELDDGDSADYNHASDLWAGFGGTVSVGYRWSVVGLYVDQDLGGIWWTGDEKVDPTFVGGTYLTCRLFMMLREKAEIDFGIGVGTMYSGGKATKQNLLVSNEKGERSAAFAIRAGASLTYYVTPSIGIGINMDYNLGLNIYKVEQEVQIDWDYNRLSSGKVYHLIHHMNPGIHITAQF